MEIVSIENDGKCSNFHCAISTASPELPEMLAPFGFPEHQLAMVFKGLASPFERFSAAPLPFSFQSMPLPFQRFASANLGAGNLFLALRPFPSFLGQGIARTCEDQN